MPLATPVLLIVFNRPELTRRVFQAIREARPSRLFIAADGARPKQPGEEDLCAEVRRVVRGVDWDGEVHELFRERNAGCRVNVSEGISWFFQHVDEGIILEDDCLPHRTFFRFCSELLQRFRDDERVFKISGTNLLGTYEIDSSYFYSIYGSIWGWASWRRAWRHYDADLALWPKAKEAEILSSVISSPVERREYEDAFDRTFRGEIDSWDYQWAFARFINRGLTVLPCVNLVENIGFDPQSTHAMDPTHPYAAVPARAMNFPLKHPEFMVHDQRFRALTNARAAAHEGPRLRRRIRRSIRQRLSPLVG